MISRVHGPDEATSVLDTGLRDWPNNPVLVLGLVSLALDRGDTDQARTLLAHVVQEHPRHARRSLLVPRTEIQAGRPEAAVEPARSAVPANPILGRAVLAAALHLTGTLDDDPAVLDAVIADPPQEPWALEWVAEVLFARARFEDAVEILNVVTLAVAPEDLGARRLRGIARARLTQYDEAGRDLAFVAERTPEDDTLTAMRGEIARLQDDPKTAVELLGSLDLESSAPWVAVSLGDALMVLDDAEAAASAYQVAIARNGDDVRALCGLAQIAFRDGADSGGEHTAELLRHAIDVDPDNELPHALLGEMLRRHGDLKEALEAFDRALAIRPDYVYALASKGQTLVATGDVDSGIGLLAEAARLNPVTEWVVGELTSALEARDGDRADDLLRRLQRDIVRDDGDIRVVPAARARLAHRQRRWTDAHQLYRKAREAGPEDMTLAIEHITVLRRMGSLSAALQLIEALPSSTVERDRDVRWQRIELLWELGRLTETRAQLEQLAHRSVPDPPAQAALGEIYRADGMRPQGRELLEAALASQPDNPYALTSLGTLEADDGDPERARRLLQQALAIHPGHAFAFEALVTLELEQGSTKEVYDLLARLGEVGSSAAETAEIRSAALYGLGDYAGALRELEDRAVEGTISQSMLVHKGRIELALGRTHRATRTFETAAGEPGGANPPSLLVDHAFELTRVDRWTEAHEMCERASAQSNPFADTARAVVWLRCGEWDTAADLALRGRNSVLTSATAYVAARTSRMAGRAQEAVESARQAVTRSPRDVGLSVELAECHHEAGQQEQANALYQNALTRLKRRSHLDLDKVRMLGHCYLRLGDLDAAAEIWLRALSAVDQVAEVLLDLTFLSLVDGDVRQASVLRKRVWQELKLLLEPSRRSVLATGLHDLELLRGELTGEPLQHATRLIDEFTSAVEALTPLLVGQSTDDRRPPAVSARRAPRPAAAGKSTDSTS
jgi:tetratricopeptide (TPR) repeat protein